MKAFFAEYTSFGLRLIAGLMDLTWLAVVVMACFYFLLGADVFMQLMKGDTEMLQTIIWQAFLLNDILPFLLILFFWMRYGTTPGKILADCKIVNATTGEPMSLGQAVLRYFAYLISALPMGLGFLWILWDKKHQGWHDKIANTVVIMHDELDVPLNKLIKYN